MCSALRMRSSMSSKTCVYLIVRRRCLVCDHEDELEERDGTDVIGTPCSSCSAPSERIEILGRRTRPVEVNPHASALGRLGGLKGGPARAAKLSPERRTAALQKLNTEACTCGCDNTVAKCRIDDPKCATSLPLAQRIVAEIAAGGQ